MSPKISENNKVDFDSKRIKECIKLRGMKISHFAEDVFQMDYPNFSRKLRTGAMTKKELEFICDELNVSMDYLTGNSPMMMPRMMDFNVPDKKREALKELLKYSNSSQNIIDRVDELDMFSINNITFLVELSIKDKQAFYRIVFGGHNPNEFEERKDD